MKWNWETIAKRKDHWILSYTHRSTHIGADSNITDTLLKSTLFFRKITDPPYLFQYPQISDFTYNS